MYSYKTILLKVKPQRLCFSVTKNFCSQSQESCIADTKDFSTQNQLKILKNCVSTELFQYLTVIRPNLKVYLKNRKQVESGTANLFDKIMSYKSTYIEKTVLISEELAERIAHNVAIHTRGDKSTTFFDGEGGLCQVAAAMDRLDIFNQVAVLEKDMTLTDLHNFAKEQYIDPRTEIHNINLVASASDFLTYKQRYHSPFARLLPVGEAEELVPSTCLVTTASHGFIKYLTQRRLSWDNPLGEFYSARPEFFLIVTARTYFHMCCSHHQLEPVNSRVSEQQMRDWITLVPKTPKLTLPYNVMFQMLFDFCLVDVLPRAAYFPWKPYSEYGTARGLEEKPKVTQPAKKYMQEQYKNNQENLMLVYARPKLDSEVQISRPDYLEYFLRQVLKNKKQHVVILFESWVTGSGMTVVEAGFTIFTTVVDLDIDQLLGLFKLLTELPGFKQSNFVVEADIFRKSSDMEVSDKTTSTESMKTKLKRELAVGKVRRSKDQDILVENGIDEYLDHDSSMHR